jgi:asparagine synthetase B (glutamine-hydrolysing)
LPAREQTNRSAARPLLRAMAGAMSARHGDLARALHTAAADSWLRAHVAARQVFTIEEVHAIAGVEPLPIESILAARLEAAPPAAARRSDLARSLWLDARTQLADDLLLYGDKISMAHSLEVRVPYLGAGLLAMMENLPDAQRVDYLSGKRVLKAWARRILPEQIVRRPKRGFQIPNLFRSRRFRDESVARARDRLGNGSHGLGWDADRIAAHIADGAHGGAAEVRAWTLHSLARWIELRSPQAGERVADGGRHVASALRTQDDTVV